MRATDITGLPEMLASGQSLPIRIDLHVHTRRYSACAPSLALEQIMGFLNCGHIDDGQGVQGCTHDCPAPRAADGRWQ